MYQLGPEHWLPGDWPDEAPGPICEWEHCSKTLTPGPAGSNKRFCSAQCRRKAWMQKQAAASERLTRSPSTTMS